MLNKKKLIVLGLSQLEMENMIVCIRIREEYTKSGGKEGTCLNFEKWGGETKLCFSVE
jgi:hypothetical protein